MKTARLTLLTTPEFKAFLGVEAARGGVSVAELVRTRCEQRPTADEEALAVLTQELRTAVQDAQASLSAGLAEAASVLTELRGRREQLDSANLGSPARSPVKKPAPAPAPAHAPAPAPAPAQLPSQAPGKVRKLKAHA